MPVEVRHAKKVTRGITTADLARAWGMTPQAAEKRVNKPEAPRPIVVITTMDDQGHATKEQKVWTPDQWGL